MIDFHFKICVQRAETKYQERVYFSFDRWITESFCNQYCYEWTIRPPWFSPRRKEAQNKGSEAHTHRLWGKGGRGPQGPAGPAGGNETREGTEPCLCPSSTIFQTSTYSPLPLKKDLRGFEGICGDLRGLEAIGACLQTNTSPPSRYQRTIAQPQPFDLNIWRGGWIWNAERTQKKWAD